MHADDSTPPGLPPAPLVQPRTFDDAPTPEWSGPQAPPLPVRAGWDARFALWTLAAVEVARLALEVMHAWTTR